MLFISFFTRLRKRLIVTKSGALLCGKPNIMDVALNHLFYLAAGINVVHIRVEDDFEHHLRMVGTTAFLLIQLFELFQVKTLYYGIDNANRIVFCYILVGVQQKKQSVVVTVRFCM